MNAYEEQPEKESNMESVKQQQRSSMRAAVIGLVGTALTVCGGLSGALIGGLATIYKVEQEVQQLSIAAPQSDRSLAVDTRQVAISASEAAALDPAEFLVIQDLGFVMPQPVSGWDQGGRMMYQDLFLEQRTNLSPTILFSAQIGNTWDEQAVYRLRYSEPVAVQFLQGSTENGISVDPRQLENDTLMFYSQMTVLALEKAVARDFTIYGLALNWGILHWGGVNTIIANPDSQYVFEQVSWEFKNVGVDEHKTDLTLQRWALFAEGPDHYYIVEVQYVPASNQSVQVWDELQAYLDAFRVIK